MSLCILCGESLNNGKSVNREHYVPQVIIRNYKKLRVPEKYTHALRIDLREEDGELLLAPKSAHKNWATVRVHERCNLDASPMCQDLKWIIDNLDKDPAHKTSRILEYYGHIWGLKPDKLTLRIIPDSELEKIYASGSCGLAYTPGYFWVGKIVIGLIDPGSRVAANDYEKHTIFIGSEKSLERVIEDYADGEEPDYANPYR